MADVSAIAPKFNVLGVLVNRADYALTCDSIFSAAMETRPLIVAPVAVQSVMTAVFDVSHRGRLNNFDMVVTDGQPVRWAMNLLHRAKMTDRVYGPSLMAQLCDRSAREQIPIYLYGVTNEEVLDKLVRSLAIQFEGIRIAGAEVGRFSTVAPNHHQEVVSRIRASGAKIVFVGLGGFKQEVFGYESRTSLGIPIVCVGAAYDYLAGLRKEPPALMAKVGLQWLHRLFLEPRRLWRRYIFNNPAFILLAILQLFGVFRPNSAVPPPMESESRMA